MSLIFKLHPEGVQARLEQSFNTLSSSLSPEIIKELVKITIEVLRHCTEQIKAPSAVVEQAQSHVGLARPPSRNNSIVQLRRNSSMTSQIPQYVPKRKTYAQAVFQKRDTVEVGIPQTPPIVKAQIVNSPSKFVRQPKPPREPQNVKVTAFWIVDTPDPKDLTYKEWRSNLYQQGAPLRSIIELRHPLRNVLEVITTQENVAAVMAAAAKLNSNIKEPSPFERVWEAAQPLTEAQIARMATSYANSIKYSPSQVVRQYLRYVASKGVEILVKREEIELAQKIQTILGETN